MLSNIRSSIPSSIHGVTIINGDLNFAYDPDAITSETATATSWIAWIRAETLDCFAICFGRRLGAARSMI